MPQKKKSKPQPVSDPLSVARQRSSYNVAPPETMQRGIVRDNPFQPLVRSGESPANQPSPMFGTYDIRSLLGGPQAKSFFDAPFGFQRRGMDTFAGPMYPNGMFRGSSPAAPAATPTAVPAQRAVQSGGATLGPVPDPVVPSAAPELRRTALGSQSQQPVIRMTGGRGVRRPAAFGYGSGTRNSQGLVPEMNADIQSLIDRSVRERVAGPGGQLRSGTAVDDPSMSNQDIIDDMRRIVDQMAADGTRLSSTQGDQPQAAPMNQEALALQRVLTANGVNPNVGFGPSASGVLRNGTFTPRPAMSLGGQTLGDRLAAARDAQAARSAEGQVGRNAAYDEWAAAQASPAAVEQRAEAMRERYGEGQPIGREGAIMARTDLSDFEKERFIALSKRNRQGPTAEERQRRMEQRETRENYFANLRRQQMEAQNAVAQRAMMSQMMNQNPELALRLMDLQQRGQATAAQMGLAQQRLGLDRELGQGELDMGQSRLGLERERLAGDQTFRSQQLGLDSQRLEQQGDQFERQLSLDEKLGQGRLDAQTESNAISRLGTEGQLSAAEEANRLRQMEIELRQNQGYSEPEIAMISELAGAFQQEGMSASDAFNEAARRVRSMQSGQLPPPIVEQSPSDVTADPVAAQQRLQTMSAPNSPLAKTFSVLGLPDQPEALDIASKLMDRQSKGGKPVSQNDLGRLREYMLMRTAVDPEFMPGEAWVDFGGAQASRAVIQGLADPNVPLDSIADLLTKQNKAKRKQQRGPTWGSIFNLN